MRRFLSALASRVAGDRKASTSLLFGLAAPVLLGTAAFATDMGVLYLRHRSLQAAVDAAAVAAAGHPDIAATVAKRVLNAAGQSDAVISLQFGQYDRDAPDRDERFTPRTAGLGDAVRIEASVKGTLHLGRIIGIPEPQIRAHAEAAVSPVVSMSIGSRLAAVDLDPLNALLSSALGVTINLTRTDYTHLAHSEIELGDLLATVAGSEGKVGEALARPVRVADLLTEMARVMGRRDDPVAMAVLNKAARQMLRSDAKLALGQILRLDDAMLKARVAYPSPAMKAKLSVLDVFNGAMKQRGIGSPVSFPLSVPALGGVEIAFQLGEAGVSTRGLSVSEDLPRIETDLLRLRARISTGGLLDKLRTGLDLPLELVVGGGTAEVVDVQCPSDKSLRKVTVRVRPGVAKLALGKWTDPLSEASIHGRLPPVQLLEVLGAGIEAQAFVTTRAVAATEVTFTSTDIQNGTVKSVRTSTVLQSLIASLLQQVQLTPRGAAALPLVPVVGTALATLAVPLDALLNSVLAATGIGVGEVNLRVDDLICGHARIVG